MAGIGFWSAIADITQPLPGENAWEALIRYVGGLPRLHYPDENYNVTDNYWEAMCWAVRGELPPDDWSVEHWLSDKFIEDGADPAWNFWKQLLWWLEDGMPPDPAGHGLVTVNDEDVFTSEDLLVMPASEAMRLVLADNLLQLLLTIDGLLLGPKEVR